MVVYKHWLWKNYEARTLYFLSVSYNIDQDLSLIITAVAKILRVLIKDS